jgi:SARP family transcriptional regulator, regulator of embCAB operon
MSNVGLQFGVLGPLQLRSGSALVPLGAPKQRAVLAMLVMNRNHAVSVDALIDAVWGDSPVPAARTSIHSYVSNLRRLLSSGIRDPNQVLASVPPGYQLNVADADCDLGRFVTEKNAGVHALGSGRFEEASTYLAAALAEWRGPFLDDLREFAFVDPFATALTELRVAVQTSHAEAEIACGRADAIIPRLELLSTEHPYRERLWAQLITAYYVTERQSDALNAYQRLKTNLAENLGIDPGPTIRSLHEQVLRQEPLGTAPQAAQTTATRRIDDPSLQTGTMAGPSATAELCSDDGKRYRLQSSNRIGRRSDNDIVLDDDDVSRYHAVVIDTGSGFVISDLKSTNGVIVAGRRIRGSATLTHGDRIRIGGHEFTFEIR